MTTVAFCTLAIGEYYRERVTTLIDSVLQFTDHDLYVMTDKWDHGNWYGPRIKVVNYTSDMPLEDNVKNRFNYNTKLLPPQYVRTNSDVELIIWVDADSFLFGWSDDYSHFKQPGVYARLRAALCDETHPIVAEKCEKMGIDKSAIVHRVPIECIMFYNQVEPLFYEEWRKVANHGYSLGCTSFFEAMEFAVAGHRSNTEFIGLGHTFSHRKFFRCLHQNKIITPLIY